MSGMLIMSAGLVALGWTYTDFQDSNVSTELLNLSISRYSQREANATPTLSPVDAEEVAEATRELSTPWSRLLVDLELAARDSEKNIALLEIAPDKDKRNVRITGEARSLPHVLNYVSRLQSAQSIRFPILETHEIQVSDKDRPVRFVVLAEWRIEG